MGEVTLLLFNQVPNAWKLDLDNDLCVCYIMSLSLPAPAASLI